MDMNSQVSLVLRASSFSYDDEFVPSECRVTAYALDDLSYSGWKDIGYAKLSAT